jgi:Xaa-Pro aminopeptidase
MAGHIPAWGHTSVDFERRIDHDRLRRYRLARTRQALQASKAGSLLLFDVNNIRYVGAPRSASGNGTRCAASAC